jgi:glycolate oxidase iron-sulfur subunit
MTLAQTRKPGLIARGARWVGLRQAMPYVNRLRAAARLLRLYQRAGLQRLVRSLDILPSQFAAMENILPPLSSGHYDYAVPAPAVGERRGTVALFYGCLQDAFLAEVNAATVHVLQRNGFQVCFPPGQTCCGAAQLHVGETELARDLARKNIDAFLASAPAAGGYTAIVDNAGGCGAVLKEYAAILQDDLAYAEKAQRFVAMVQDVAEFLAAHRNVPPKGFVKSRVTYSDSCHLRNVQGVVRQPRDLIRAIPGVDYVELGAPDRCCGSAGVYNLVNPDMANAILDVRMKEIAATGADTIVTTNTGCHLQLLYGVRRARLNARVIHLVELLDESYRMEVN